MTSLAPPTPERRASPDATAEQRTARTPLAAVLAFTAANALSAGLVTSGMFFAARAGYGFGPSANYGLGVLVGAGYTVGALLAARIVTRARGRARAVLARVLALLALATLWPLLLPGRPIAIWLVAACYGPTVAVLWPIVQSYVSGGRDGRALRTAVGHFNVTWGSALVVGFWFLGPWLERSPGPLLAALGALHLSSALILRWFTPAPASVGPLVDPARAELDVRDIELRRVLQALLPLTNVLGFALAPFLPEAFAALGLPSASRASFAVAWLLPRAVAFGVLGRWHGWYGRFATAWLGAGLLIGGFALALLAPWSMSVGVGRGAALAIEVLGLAAFGIGMATVYTAAFYYAQAAGRAASVGAGGRHEALLGVGATVGPLLGLAIAGAVELGAMPAAGFEPALVVCCSLLAVGLAWRALRR